jgi:parallel beta-helix repeat protein
MQKKMYCKTLAIGIIVLFIGAGIYPSSGINVEEKPIMSIINGNTLYVGGDGPANYTKIQDAINNASDEDTVFVFDDSSPYYELLDIEKAISLIGEDKNTTIIDGKNLGTVVQVFSDSGKLYLSGFTIRNGKGDGFSTFSDYNHITNNIMMNNNGNGIRLQNSNNNIISGNTIKNNSLGMVLYYSDNNIISNNFFFNSSLGVEDSYHNIVDNNMVNGKPLVYLEDESNKMIDYELGHVILVNCNHITIENLDISYLGGIGFWTGGSIYLWKTNNCIIRNNDLSNNNNGINLIYSSDNTIIGNTVLKNRYGIVIIESNRTTITENNIISNNERGIYVGYSHNNNIFGNNISNNQDGIKITGEGNTIWGNTISNNSYGIEGTVIRATISGNEIKNNVCGIDIDGMRSTISGNNITNNDDGILLMLFNFFNNILKNNFINNGRDVFFSNAILNRWKQNYWDEPGIDKKTINGEFRITISRGGFQPPLIITIPWKNFDRNPAQEPYVIENVKLLGLIK